MSIASLNRNFGDWVTTTGTPQVEAATTTLTLSAGNAELVEGEHTLAAATTLLTATAVPPLTPERVRSLGIDLPVEIPLILSGASQPGDVRLPGEIVIAGTDDLVNSVHIWAVPDADADDENVTVTLGAPPTGFILGTPKSVTIRIDDDDEPQPPPVTLADVKLNVQVTAGDHKLTLRWTLDRALPDAVAVRGYDVRYKEVGETADSWIDHGGGEHDPAVRQTTRVIDGLTPGIEYDVEVRLVTSSGSTSWFSATGTPTAGGGTGVAGGTVAGGTVAGGGTGGGDGGGGAQCPRPHESAYSASISNRCDGFDEGHCHGQLGEDFLRRNASSTVVLLESESDFDLCIYDRDRADEWPRPIYVARKEDCVDYSLDSHGLQAQLTGKVEDHNVQIAELPDIARMDYCVVPFGDAVGRWDVRFHQPATLYGTVAPGSRKCPRHYDDNDDVCASWGGSNYANLTVKLENCRGTWIDKGGTCDEPFVVRPEERADLADDGAEKCVVVNDDRTLRDVDGVRRPTLELAYCFFDDGMRRLGTYRD